MAGKKKVKEVEIPNRCQGWRRYGGVFTIGIPVWEQCKEVGTVMIKFKDEKGVRQLPACPHCWKETMKQEGLKILSVTPILPETENVL